MITSKPETMDEYLAPFPAEVQERMQLIRNVIHALIPEATEAISYQIPCFKLKGNLIHFAAFKNHIGLYPGALGIETYKEEISGYKWAKGSVQFPLDKPLPLDLIRKIAAWRIEQYFKKEAEKAKKKRE